MKTVIWRGVLDSDFNERYWRAVTEKYARYDLFMKIFLGLTTSGTVAAWGIWQEYQMGWKVLSACSAAAAVTSPFLRFGKKVEIAAAHAGFWADLRVRYADLWDLYKAKGEPATVKEQDRLKRIFLALEQKEPKLKIPQDERLARRCQAAVLQSKGLKRG